MLGKPIYKLGDIVTFVLSDFEYTEESGYVLQITPETEKYTGKIRIIDAYGTFEDPSDVSYDILVDNCLYKHINEQMIIKD